MNRLSHVDEAGLPHMVDVGDKEVTDRRATAAGQVVMEAATLEALTAGQTPKGDPLVVARIAGIQAAKRTAELIPLCHTLPLTAVEVELEPDESLPGVRITATARTRARTGVEMEALAAVSVAALTLYDMLKAVDRGMRIEAVHLVRKSGGRSGDWQADADV